MKALTIEEIKQLKYGDWVWIKTNNSQYLRVNFSSEILSGETLCGIKTYYYADYGKTWVAYKNKEQAECRGELVELPCKVGDKVYYLNTFPSISLKTNTIYKGEVVRFHILNSFNSLDMTISLEIKIHNEYGTTAIPNIKDFGVLIFETKEQAEQKLKELINING